MNNFNRQQILYCTYCGRECNNLNSLKQHECRCKLNPNHITCKGGINNHTTKTKGYKWINNGYEQLYLPSNKINNYLLNGWKLGMNNVSKQNISKSLLGKSKGIASTIEKELERKQKISNSLKGNTNWMFNKHHGNAKQGWYKGIHCDSTWELAYLVYHIEHNLYIKRCDIYYDFVWENEHHKYIPDFITNEGIIEIKGRKTKKSLEKEKQFPNIKIIDINSIKPYINYVINKYGDTFWNVLYENNG